MKYTIQELKNKNDIVFYLEDEEEWKKLKKYFTLTTTYYGNYCYNPRTRSYSSSSSRNNPGIYGDNISIITFDDIIFPDQIISNKIVENFPIY